MRKLLWVGDAAVATGFARCTHKTLETLKDHWDVSVLGLNYRGEPHQYPYPIYPCWPGGDMFGVGRIAELCVKIQPDVVVIQNDPWNIPAYLDEMDKLNAPPPTVAVMPVDGKNVAVAQKLNRLTKAIFWTNFALNEARLGGFHGDAAVIPLGIDLGTYKLIPKSEARNVLGLSALPENAFIVGCLNRNQPRKRLDLLIECFSEWINRHHRNDAYLYLHVCPTGDMGYDVKQLMRYYGFRGNNKRLILSEPDIGQGIPEDMLSTVYSAFDVQLSTTQGEGWGLTTMEGMACGVPQIVPDWSALGEWTEDAVLKSYCSSTAVTPNFVNVIGGVVDKESVIDSLEIFYSSPVARQQFSRAGFELVSRPQFRWSNIGQRFVEELEGL